MPKQRRHLVAPSKLAIYVSEPQYYLMTLEQIAFTTAGILLTLPFISWYAHHRPTLGIRLHTASWGSVYVFQSVDFPHLFKVGYTTRRVAIRKAEVERDMLGDQRLRIVFAVCTPFALSVETVAHRRLRRCHYAMAGGIEFFKGDAAGMIRAVRLAARDVRRMAKRQGRWSPEDGLMVREWFIGQKR